MIEQSVTITVTRAEIETIEDARELQDWVASQPGLYCAITALAAGGWYIEVGGQNADFKPIEFGDTVTWDGQRFSVSRPPVLDEG